MDEDRICHTCIWSEKFNPRPDEPSSFSCRHPEAGGVYVLDPDHPTCLPRDWAARLQQEEGR